LFNLRAASSTKIESEACSFSYKNSIKKIIKIQKSQKINQNIFTGYSVACGSKLLKTFFTTARVQLDLFEIVILNSKKYSKSSYCEIRKYKVEKIFFLNRKLEEKYFKDLRPLIYSRNVCMHHCVGHLVVTSNKNKMMQDFSSTFKILQHVNFIQT